MLKKRFYLLRVLVAVGLVFSFALATPMQAFADEGTQDDPTPEATEAPATDEASTEEAPVDETPTDEVTEEAATEIASEEGTAEATEAGSEETPAQVSVDEAPAEEIGASEDMQASDVDGEPDLPVENEETLADVAAALSESDSILVDEEGDVVSLASQEALDVLSNPDPYVERSGVTHRFLADCTGQPIDAFNTCTTTPTPIQAAINFAVDGETVQIEAGTFNEAVTVNKQLNIVGVGDGDNPAANTIITFASGNVVAISANNVTLSNLRVDGLGTASNAIHITSTVSDVTFQSITATGATNGLRVGGSVTVDGMTVDDSHFDGNTNGWYLSKESASSNPHTVKDVTVTNTSFSNNSNKGIYAEKLEDALFDNIEVIDSGINPLYGFNNGIDINLKWASYSNITIQNSLVQGSGLLGSASDPLFASAITIKGRDQGSYGSTPASLSNVTIDNVTILGGENGIRFGEPHGANPLQAEIANLVVTNSSIYGNAGYGLVNETLGTINAENNWWGCSEGPGGINCDTISGSVDFTPWLTVAPPATDADLDGIADSGDNCPAVANTDQADNDDDGVGNACDRRNDSETDDGTTSPTGTGTGGLIIPVTGAGFYETANGISLFADGVDGALIGVTELDVTAPFEAYGQEFEDVLAALQLDIPATEGVQPTISIAVPSADAVVTVVLPDGTTLDLATTCTTNADGTQTCVAFYTPDGSEGSLAPIIVIH